MTNLPFDQKTIRARCFHRTGIFLAFPVEDVESSIAERFKRIVGMYPDRIAVKTPMRELTYSALDALSNGIACSLLKRQKETRSPVALFLESSELAITSVLGVIKSRQIYVPLDPSYPQARLRSVLEDSGATTILTDQKNADLARELSTNTRLCLTLEEMSAKVCRRNIAGITSPTDPVAIFYTSGSTGQPKGVVQNHRGVLHRIMADTNTFHVCREDRLSLLSSPAYSVSMRNLFGALLNGATVCPFDIAGDGLHHLKEWLISEDITIYFSVPTVFRQFVQTLQGDESFKSLRLIYLGGESVTKEDVQLYKRHFPEALLVNSLASNEAGIIAYYFMDKHDQLSESSVPVGYPAEGKDLLILGKDGENIGVGTIGEIAVRSRFLSPGYWQNRTVTSFALNADPTDCDLRIYHTGDQGYIRDDGCLIHLGRKGLRVKIRGSRVELEEVEAALRQHSAIREVVVDTARDQVEGDRLIAHVVLREGQKLSVADLRDDLTAKFPPYMIPSRFIYLETLPRTPNGKVDRGALPKPDKSRPLLKTAYALPATEDQKLLAQIWSEVLSIDRVGIYDNFFELGGNSLLATVLLARINREFRKDLSISVVYQAPTVEQLAKAVKGKFSTHSWRSLLSLQPQGVKPPFFWIHGQASDAVIGEYLGLDQPVYGLIHQSMDGKPASYTTVESIAAHYLLEIRTVQSQGPYLLGGYCFGGLIAFEIAQQLKTQNEETSLLFLLDPPDYIAASHSGSAFRPRLESVRTPDIAGWPTRDAAYLITRTENMIKRRIRIIVSLVCRVARRIIINSALKWGRPIPVGLRSSYILDVYDDAIRYYCPTLYRGQIIIVKAAEDNRNPETWSHLAGKGVEIHIVPGNHQNILREPYVGAWLEKLKCHMEV